MGRRDWPLGLLTPPPANPGPLPLHLPSGRGPPWLLWETPCPLPCGSSSLFLLQPQALAGPPLQRAPSCPAWPLGGPRQRLSGPAAAPGPAALLSSPPRAPSSRSCLTLAPACAWPARVGGLEPLETQARPCAGKDAELSAARARARGCPPAAPALGVEARVQDWRVPRSFRVGTHRPRGGQVQPRPGAGQPSHMPGWSHGCGPSNSPDPAMSWFCLERPPGPVAPWHLW